MYVRNALLNYPSYLYHQDQVVQPTTSTTHREPPTKTTATPRGFRFQSHVTRASGADYTVYIIKRNDCTVAVLIEAKHTTHKVVEHPLAQVTG